MSDDAWDSLPTATVELEGVKLYHADCLDVMALLPVGCFAACVTDPPYGIRSSRGQIGGSKPRSGDRAITYVRQYQPSEWDDKPPAKLVFVEIRRVSAHQVIFGANYFSHCLPASSSWIVWNKDNGESNFSDCELAWTSRKSAVRMFTHRQNGMFHAAGQPKDERLHPTQKPERLMRWVLKNYTEPGDVVFDPFLGSGTTGVAAVQFDHRFVGIDISREYVDLAARRIEQELAQGKLFQ